MQQSFGQLIRQARKNKGYSQRDLAKLIPVDFTYLSKLENNRAARPSEEFIRSLAPHLDLDEEELIFLAGRIPERDEDFLKKNYQAMPALFRRMQENPDFAQKVFQEATQPEDEEEQN
ncbi:XRE family transcriptional regulator [Microcoleus sp. FACHB-831]|uniref:helix-turn-helix domain-containing protein n=1 Tax=Microcoleus sp. FACHB-831 TaxID=2692827 RepID=UPI0016870326|nr:helix-turn-helix transcriptional regulator [Microcoleus sp. FACHB-831]MBD1923895.1 XRE family transcriptional regulator [Microcoleus sp. FACHB-831]